MTLVYVHNMPDILVLSALVPKAFGAKVILDQHDPMPELMRTIFNLDENSSSVRLIRAAGEVEHCACGFGALPSMSLANEYLALAAVRPEKIGVVMNSPDGGNFSISRSSLAYPRTTIRASASS